MKRLLVIAAIMAGATVAALWPLQALTLRSGDRVLYRMAVHPHDHFSLGYLHSVELSDVWDRFVIGSDYRLILTETRFQGQGAGLPASAVDGEQWRREGPWFKITGMHRILPRLHWRIGAKWHNRLVDPQGHQHDLSAAVGDALILVEVERIHLIDWLIYRVFSGSEIADASREDKGG
jgi:hypothetical protein